MTGEDVARALEILARAPLKVCKDTRTKLELASRKLLKLEPERIRECLKRVLTSEFRTNVLTEYSNLMFNMIPHLETTYGLGQYNDEHKYDVYKHTIETLNNLDEYDDIVLIMATILHDIGKPQTLCYDVNGD